MITKGNVISKRILTFVPVAILFLIVTSLAFAISIKKQNDIARERDSMVTVTKYDNELPLEIEDGRIVKYIGVTNGAVMEISSKFVKTEDNKVFPYSEENLKLGEYVQITSIGEEAFKDIKFKCLTVDLDGITEIGNSAFENAENVVFNGGTGYTIGDYAFQNAKIAIGDILIRPNGDSPAIGVGAFNGMVSIDPIALMDTNNLSAATPVGTPTIKPSKPRGAIQISSASLTGGITAIDLSEFIGSVTFNNSVAQNNADLTTVKLPAGTTRIGSNAFKGASHLSTFVANGTIVSLGANAFSGCTELTDVDLTNATITQVPAECFSDCGSTISVVLPQSITNADAIASDSFGGTTAPISVVITSASLYHDITFGWHNKVGTDTIKVLQSVDDGSNTYFNGFTKTTSGNVNIYTAKTYSISFNGNGATSGSMSSLTGRIYGHSYTLTTNAFSRTGYIFAGWATSANGAVAYADGASVNSLTTTNNGVVELFAKWTANTYKVEFDANGGSGSMSDQNFTYGTAQNLTTNAFTRANYSFVGWNTAANGSGTSYENGAEVNNLTTVNNGTVTLYAQWELNAFTLTLTKGTGISSVSATGTGVSGETINGSNVSYTVVYNSSVAISAVLTTGYETLVWTTSDVTITSNSFTQPAKNVSITASASLIRCTITLAVAPEGYGSWSGANFQVDYGSSVSISDNVLTVGETTRTASAAAQTAQYTYAFSSISDSGSGTVQGNRTLTANFTRTTRQYTVSFAVNTSGYGSWSSSTSLTVDYGTSITINGSSATIGSTERTATAAAQTAQYTYAFSNISDSGSGKIQGNRTLTANFTRTTRQYTVSFNQNNGTGGQTSSVTATYGSAMPTITAVPTRTGYTFAGYYDATSGGTKYYNADKSSARAWDKTDATTLYAQWTVNSYNLKVYKGQTNILNASTLASNYSVNGNNMTLTYATTDGGTYTLTPSSSSDPYAVINATANFTAGTKYYIHARVLKSNGELLTSGGTIQIFYAKDGGFNETESWSTNGDTYAEITPRNTGTYRFRFDNDYGTNAIVVKDFWISTTSGDIVSTTINYGATYDLGSMSRTGNTFSSWIKSGSGSISGNTFTMGAGDAVVSAHYTINTHTILFAVNASGYGSWSNSTPLTVNYGTTITISGNSVTVGSNAARTASAAAQTAQYTYAFSNIIDSGLGSGTVQANRTLTASFTRAIRQYTVSFAVNTSGYGSWSSSTSLTVNYGTSITISGSKATIGSTERTASAAAQTAQYTYALSNITDSGSGNVTSNRTLTANFTRTTRSYTITFSRNNSGYGTLSANSIANVPYGTSYSTSDNTFTCNGTTITATAKAQTVQYTYAFDSWSSTTTTGTVTGNTTITANFTRTTRTYTISFSRNNSGYGTLNAYSIANVPYGTSYSTSGNEFTCNGTTITATRTHAAGYTTSFSSWSSTSGTVTGATSITANFTRTANTITISLNKQSGSGGSSSFYYKYNSSTYYSNSACTSSITSISVPSRSNYVFKGYYTGTNGSGTQYVNASGTIVNSLYTAKSSDFTLYAYWVRLYTLTLICWKGGDKNNTTTYTYTVESGASLPSTVSYYATSVKGGFMNWTTYYFKGYWTGDNGTGTQYYNENASRLSSAPTMSGDLTLIAKFE